jgi:hypothetical protein
MSITRCRALAGLLLGGGVLLVPARAQVHESEPYDPIHWASTPPEGCPFEPSKDVVGVTFTGRHREYASSDCWNPSWASDGNMYSCYSDGAVENLRPDGTRVIVHAIGNKAANVQQLKRADADNGVGKIVGDDPMNLTVTALPPLSTPVGPYDSRYPSGSLVHDGIWYYGTHPEGPGGAGPFTGFMVSKDFGKTWPSGRNDATDPLFPTPAPFLDEEGEPVYVPVRIVEPFFVDFGQNLEHSPDGKAYLIAHGATQPANGKDRYGSHWHIGDQAFLLRVRPSPENINDERKYEFFAGHDEADQAVWTPRRSEMKPLFTWNGHVGPTTMVWNPGLERFLACVVVGETGEGVHGRYDTYILESKVVTGPWRLVTYMRHFGEQGYFVNIPSKFLSDDGRTAWLCYAANFSASITPTLKQIPPGSRYAMNLHEFRLGGD